MDVICPYCHNRARLTDSACVYNGKSKGLIWYCKACDAYVGVHTGTDVPLGTLANARLRSRRRVAHMIFDKLWQGTSHGGTAAMSRAGAYVWLSERMGIPVALAHIGMFDAEQCEKAIACSMAFLNTFEEVKRSAASIDALRD